MQETKTYYTTGGRKAGDFFIGFFGALILSIIFMVVTWAIAFLIGRSVPYFLAGLVPFLYLPGILFLGLAIWAIVRFRKTGRRFIGHGILTYILLAVILPIVLFLILLGACFFGGGFY